MDTIWNSYKRKTGINITLLMFASVLNLFIFASQNHIYSQMSCSHIDFECQVNEATKLIEKSPDNYINYYNRAISYRRMSENELAIADYSKVIELKSELYEGFYNRSVIYYEMGKTDEAILDIEKVLEINPDLAKIHFFYGLICFENKKFEKALNSFNLAIEIDSNFSKAYEYRAKIFQKFGETEKAKADLEKVKSLKDNS